MHTVMLVIDSEIERMFLNKLIKRLGFNVISARNSKELAAELSKSFPDVVFASIIGKSSQTLNSLAAIKAAKGVPKVVFVRNSKDSTPLTSQQKAIVDGLLYSPIDPFKLLDILAKTTGIPFNSLKEKYREMVMREQGGGSPQPKKDSKLIWQPGRLINDSARNEKYKQICADLAETNKNHAEFNPDKFRELQKAQAEANQESPEHRKLKKDFIKTLFSATPKNRS